jgi:hypothetical protein
MCIIGQWRCGSIVIAFVWVGAQKAISLRALRAGFALMLSIKEFAELALEVPSACAGWGKRRSLKLVRNLLKGCRTGRISTTRPPLNSPDNLSPFAQLPRACSRVLRREV